MYDENIENYSEYKKKIDTEHELQLTKEELIKLHTKFTDLQLQQLLMSQSSSEAFENHAFDNLTELNLNLNDHTETERNKNEIINLPKLNKSFDSLVNISRSPINCPVTFCTQSIGITSVMSHFLRDHKQQIPIDFQDINDAQRSVLTFNENTLSLNENTCLGLLAYGGKNTNQNSRPALTGLSLPNSLLPEKFSIFLNHLPILIMACKTNIYSFLSVKEQATLLADQADADRTLDIIIIWLATIQTTRTVHSTITAFDNNMTSSRSTIVKVRDLKQSQNTNEFLSTESNYLMLSRGEIDILSNNNQASIEIEIFIHEYKSSDGIS